MTCMRTARNLKCGQIRQLTVGKKSPKTCNGNISVATFSRLFLIGSFSPVLAGTYDKHESFDELKIRPYSTT